MKIIKRLLIPIFALIVLIIGFVKINIINTESLAPLGNTDDNFKVVSEEFGDDFKEFIKDNSAVKIYLGEKDDGLATVKLYNKEIKLTSNNFFMNSIKKLGKQISDTFFYIKNKINKSTKTNNENNMSKMESDNDYFYKDIEDFNFSIVLG